MKAAAKYSLITLALLALVVPIMLVLARIITNKKVSLIVAAIFAAAQLILMVAWSQFYAIW